MGHGIALRFFPDYEGDISSYGENLVRPELLASALALTRQPYYRGVYEKAGALFRSMVKNHPYLDGNKRLGVATTFMFLVLNGRVLLVSNEDLVDFAIGLAKSSPTWSHRRVARWLRERTVRASAVDVGSTGVLHGETGEGLDQAKRNLQAARATLIDRVIRLGAELRELGTTAGDLP